jgi:RimJ/RimL family protein N-acetyltransferase
VSDLIETGRLRLRALEAERDAEAMLALLNDPGFLQGIGDRGVRTREQARAYLREWAVDHRARHGFAHWAVETRSDGVFLGTLGLLRRDTLPFPHLGYALLAAHRGHGYAEEAARAVLAYARDTLDLAQLCAIVSPDNAASIGLLEKLGLRRQDLRRLTPDGEMLAYYTLALRPDAVDS